MVQVSGSLISKKMIIGSAQCQRTCWRAQMDDFNRASPGHTFLQPAPTLHNKWRFLTGSGDDGSLVSGTHWVSPNFRSAVHSYYSCVLTNANGSLLWTSHPLYPACTTIDNVTAPSASTDCPDMSWWQFCCYQVDPQPLTEIPKQPLELPAAIILESKSLPNQKTPRPQFHSDS